MVTALTSSGGPRSSGLRPRKAITTPQQQNSCERLRSPVFMSSAGRPPRNTHAPPHSPRLLLYSIGYRADRLRKAHVSHWPVHLALPARFTQDGSPARSEVVATVTVEIVAAPGGSPKPEIGPGPRSEDLYPERRPVLAHGAL